jgi:SSS family solute:Na+ symporter
VLSVFLTLAIDQIKGLNLFDVFQSVLGFLAPPMSVAFLFGVLWKRTTSRAINVALTAGTFFSVGIGVLYLWVFPAAQYPAWPHFLLLSFYIFVVLSAATVAVSLLGPPAQATAVPAATRAASPGWSVWALWIVLAAVMIGLYIFFNGR